MVVDVVHAISLVPHPGTHDCEDVRLSFPGRDGKLYTVTIPLPEWDLLHLHVRSKRKDPCLL